METTDVHVARVLANPEIDPTPFGEIGVDIFTGYDVPPKPDNMIIIVDTGSWQPDNPSLQYTNPSIQITVRGAKGTRQAVGEKAFKINDFLQNWWGVEGDIRFVYINNRSGPQTMPPDDRMRPIFVINFDIQQCPNVKSIWE